MPRRPLLRCATLRARSLTSSPNDEDITEQRRLEAVLYQAQKKDAIGQLAGGVAHDFNNLLMVISSYAELMRDSIDPEHPLHRNVEEIQRASRRAADLTSQLLAFGRQQMQSLQVLDLKGNLADISLDGNYAPQRTMVPAGDYVLLEVTDRGAGIPAEHLPHIFEPFLPPRKQGKGTGLGLATVYGIVKQSSGFIRVYSERGMGATFKV